MKILVTGASGFVGSALTRRLVEKGYSVIGVSRAPEKQRTQVGVVWCRLEEAPETDAVIHLAGENVFGLWTEEKKRRVLESRVEGTRRVTTQIQKWSKGPKVFVGASAVGIYGDRGDESLNEEAVSDPRNGFLAEVCREWERESRVMEVGNAGERIRVVIPRIGLVMDCSGGMLGKQWLALKSKICWMPSCSSSYLPWISMRDMVEILVFAIENGDLSGVVNAVAPHSLTAKGWVEGLDSSLHFWVKGFIPKSLLDLFGKEFSDVLYSSQRVIPQKLLSSGFRFSHSTWEEYLASLFSKS